MAKIYADLCIDGLRTCVGAAGVTEVPAKWLAGTKAELVIRGKGDLAGVQT